MKILDTNNKFLLISINQKSLLLLDSHTLQILHQKHFQTGTNINAASLQYGTGLVGIAIGSKVHLYDFLYQREVDIFETYKTVIKLCIRKNLLFVVSDDRILIYNIVQKQNQSYIPILDGKLVFLHQNYFQLSLFYPQDHSILTSKSIWQRKVFKNITGVKYQNGCYFNHATMYVLALQNTLSFYHQEQMLKVYGFDHKVVSLKSVDNPKLVLALLQSDQIYAQNLKIQQKISFERIECNEFNKISFLQRKSMKQSQFWIVKGEIYHWIRKQGAQGNLYKAKLQQFFLKFVNENNKEIDNFSQIQINNRNQSMESKF